jgi:hypothetical protein
MNRRNFMAACASLPMVAIVGNGPTNVLASAYDISWIRHAENVNLRVRMNRLAEVCSLIREGSRGYAVVEYLNEEWCTVYIHSSCHQMGVRSKSRVIHQNIG